MRYLNPEVSYFAKTNFRNEGKLFGIFQRDRMMHLYVLGKTGTGKTNLLTTLILQDIIHGRGCAVFDVHGDLLRNILDHLPQKRIKDVIHLDMADPYLSYRYNPLKKVSEEKQSLVVGGLLDAFQKLWKGAWGMKLEHILRYIVLTLISQPKADLSDIPRIVHDREFREQCILGTTNKEVLRFWRDEFPNYNIKTDLMPILNKVGAFLAHASVRRFFIGNPTDISLRHAMDTSKIILIDISKGKIGRDASHIIGSILITSFANAAFTRIDTEEELRTPFHIFLDEFQNYTSPSISGILSELRKFRVSLTLGNQYIYQLDTDIKNAVLGNVGTLVSFRTGQQDASYLTKQFHPIFQSTDLTSLENFDIYLTLMISGKPSRPFSATTIPYKDIL
ncbi:type IV secretory system conjugative DNA transfer family protein [Candidatus Ulvibacter alkanivorans]|uniref:type IV secretory system conjugative DNA transfer family protein n=1 Tax=Candidatus Ulvibacter alkanivorans TaxID=2267620 RepID=UPI00109CE535|nr:ATP-binding protein [Candidatus Ulvibacter alkanivorans]